VGSLNKIYSVFLKTYGPQHWWPGETDFEVAIGAILTQNVAWKNVEKAVALLKEKGLLTPRALYVMPADHIAPLIRSTGYYNQKAKKIRHFLEWFALYGFSFRRLKSRDLRSLRDELLAVHGIGPETADSILLYALGKKTFVVDAYTMRIFSRVGILGGADAYDAVQRLFHRRFRGGVKEYNEFHALIVNHGKDVCRKKPRCGVCCIARQCAFGKAVMGGESG
jgi:endonuclease-3 related protein